MKILICGDSFCVSDPKFPGLHWSDKLGNRSSDFEILNMSHGGCTNAMIMMQIMLGLRFDPDFVIVSWTASSRYEIDKHIDAVPRSLEFSDIADWIKNRYHTDMYETAAITPALKKRMAECSDSFETLKSYFLSVLGLSTLSKADIPFCYSMGGLEFSDDYTALIREHFLDNLLQEYSSRELNTNLWYHTVRNSDLDLPCFHVINDRIQELFYNECLLKLQQAPTIQDQ